MRCTCNTAQSSQELGAGGGGGSTLLNFETWLASDDFKRDMVGECRVGGRGGEASMAALTEHIP